MITVNSLLAFALFLMIELPTTVISLYLNNYYIFTGNIIISLLLTVFLMNKLLKGRLNF